jgi:hypothetical protein
VGLGGTRSVARCRRTSGRAGKGRRARASGINRRDAVSRARGPRSIRFWAVCVRGGNVAPACVVPGAHTFLARARRTPRGPYFPGPERLARCLKQIGPTGRRRRHHRPLPPPPTASCFLLFYRERFSRSKPRAHS